MKYLFVILCSFLLLVSSCKPHEERVIERLNKLSDNVERNSSKWDADQWADALDELEDIHFDMEECDFTEEQLKELGRVEGRLTMIIMTEGSKALGKQLENFLEGAGSFMKGFQEGALNNFSVPVKDYENISDEVKDIGETLQEEEDRLQEEIIKIEEELQEGE